MLLKKNRVDKKEVEEIFNKGEFVNSPNLTLKFLIVNYKRQISFITPKTISKKAIIRNLLRRRGYFVLKKYFNIFPVGFLGVVIFGKKSYELFGKRKNATYNPISNLENEIKILLNKMVIQLKTQNKYKL